MVWSSDRQAILGLPASRILVLTRIAPMLLLLTEVGQVSL